MTELELYKFLHKYDIEHHWEYELGVDVLRAWIPYNYVEEFSKLIGAGDDYWPAVNLCESSISVDLVLICDANDIDPENILAKKDQGI